MKKLFISITMILTCVSIFTGCSEDAYESRYKDPSKTSDVEMEKLMAGALLKPKEWVMSTYGRFFGWEIQNLCKQANTIGITPDDGTYYNIEGYTDGLPPYGSMISMIPAYKLMKAINEQLPEAERAENEVYIMTVETMLYGFAAYIMSSFGDIPFDEVGTVTITGDIADAHPHFQDDKELYKTVLDKLGELNTKFTTVKIPTLFAPQDFVCHGDITQWRRLANSLRLRTALLVSTQGDLAAEGQRVIKEILGDPEKYPIVDSNDNLVCYMQVAKSGSELDINGGSGFDWVNLSTASTEIIRRMQKAGDGGVWEEGKDDPRLPIYFTLATPNGEYPVMTPEAEIPNPKEGEKKSAMCTVYRGASADIDYDIFWEKFTPSDSRAYFSRVRDYGFFKNNRNWDNPVVTASEMWFIKAEAMQRGWVTGDAKAAFKKAIELSIKFYFKEHNNRSHTEDAISKSDTRANNHTRSVINPDQSIYTDSWIDAFAEARWTKKIDGSSYAGGQLEAILEQKWLNFGYIYAGEQWNDLRRTGFPRMFYPRDHDAAAEIPYPRNRNRYPGSDRDQNLNFDQVRAQDNYSDVLFWAIPNWHDGPTW